MQLPSGVIGRYASVPTWARRLLLKSWLRSNGAAGRAFWICMARERKHSYRVNSCFYGQVQVSAAEAFASWRSTFVFASSDQLWATFVHSLPADGYTIHVLTLPSWSFRAEILLKGQVFENNNKKCRWTYAMEANVFKPSWFSVGRQTVPDWRKTIYSGNAAAVRWKTRTNPVGSKNGRDLGS